MPIEYRKSLDINPGDKVIIELDGDELRVRSQAAAIRRIQKDVRRYVPEGVSIVDELIANRRAEAVRDELK